ncbi:tetratricopeptide repeat protein [Pyxidicoccus fallax]|uniref:Tetratricopeptide repeat protein n=1 Tax=Pyxidicoccus fallax TaxID=394095 RepID=A0A848L6I0_9BACT|nr:tetratricopeptide repeat protein [Pyxidicoccus fallax]NMO14570.1 tetratricopeptide repeat protein [Pyxidicoccus fallax]NPC79269.1 tetratricopeptide repeat protein [Pyxidicoccus fallax]
MKWVFLAALLAGATDAAEPSTLTAPGAPVAAPAPSSLPDALALEAAGDDAGALSALEALIRAQPAWELPRLEAARLLLKTGGALDRAEAHLDTVIAKAPNNPRAWYLRGLLWEERGDRLQAIRAYEQAVQYRSSYEDARFRLGGLWASQGDWLKSELHYRYLARAKPEWVQVRLQLAEVLENQERLLDAEKELLAARTYQPGSPLVLRRLADFYERTGRPQLAQKVRKSMEPQQKRVLRELKPSRR